MNEAECLAEEFSDEQIARILGSHEMVTWIHKIDGLRLE